MTEKELHQQKEIERLQKKVQALSNAYEQAVRELNQLKNEKNSKCVMKKGRPPIDGSVKVRVLSLYQQGMSMRMIAEKEQIALGTTHKIIRQAAERSLKWYLYFDREEPATLIHVSPVEQKVWIRNFTDNMISRAFGVKENPDWDDFLHFLESRCMPRTRYGIKEELRMLGLDVYDPFLIVEITSGRVYEDHQWLKVLDQEQASMFGNIQVGKSKCQEDEELLIRLRKYAEEWRRHESEY